MHSSLLLSLWPALALASLAPILQSRAGSSIPGKYIVRLANGNLQTTLGIALKLLPKGPAHVYQFDGFSGFAAEMDDNVVELLQRLPGVSYIEQDAIVKANFGEVKKIQQRAYTTQSSATWGLGRISQQSPGTPSPYTFDSTAGANTCVYVIDTGIYTAHPEFEGRASFLANFAGDGDNTDGSGHGTHCAGTVGSKTYGVAKKTKLFAVKILDASGSGSNSGVLAGINYVANDAKSRTGCSGGFVGSMSLGGSKSTIVNSAVANVVKGGVFMVVAAGNDAQDASNTSPASEPTAFTVGASDSSDNFASFSNYGTSIDIIAPGVNILSTWNNGGTNTISGTSMAAPHVAGLAAYILAFEGKMNPAALASRLQTLALKNRIKGSLKGTPNYLAFNGNPSS
ncbi:subtilisin-like serine protease [Curvularia kusanoi]|uniref:Subtilisin-like serine protease n=1 Tax=Curvularia kusanoi TaxID=90978 RepID=A0A9P4W581_CURKU|nr:subtilisin-like serine protease [Curvularia kusanoi]